jgi:hypothetical protein
LGYKIRVKWDQGERAIDVVLRPTKPVIRKSRAASTLGTRG